MVPTLVPRHGNYPDESAQPQILAGGIATFALATLAVFFRFVSRRIQRCGYWLDDWLILGAWFISIGYLVSLIYSVLHNGMGLHDDKLTKDQVWGGHKDLFIEDITYTFSLVLIKLSVLAFYWRIFQIRPIRLPIQIITVIVFLWLIARIPPIFLRCIPLQGYWDPDVEAYCGVNIGQFFLGTVSVHLAIDVSLLILPIPFIRKLRISRSQKWGIYGIFAIGGFICISTIFQLVVSSNLAQHTDDINWYIAPVIMWAGVEINMTMVSACLPSLRPAYRFIRQGFTTAGLQEPRYHSSSDSNRGGSKSLYQTHYSQRQTKATNSDLSELITVTDEEMLNPPQMPYRCKIKAHPCSDTMPLNDLDAGGNDILVVDEVRVDESPAR